MPKVYAAEGAQYKTVELQQQLELSNDSVFEYAQATM